jgi:hypothetical protein
LTKYLLTKYLLTKYLLTNGYRESRVKFCECWRSSGVEQLPCKQWVGGSNPPASASTFGQRFRLVAGRSEAGRYPSGQRGQTVNLLANAFGGSNPPLPTTSPGSRRGGVDGAGGNSSAVERQPSKLGVAGSNPVSRSIAVVPAPWSRSRVGSRRRHEVVTRVNHWAHVAQLAERVLGKDEVSGSIPDMGSTS